MISRPRRFALASLVVVTLIVVLVGWAVPTFAGRVFVEIAPRIVPLGGGNAPNRAVILANGTSVSASRLGIGLDVTNRYPWPVLIGFQGASFQASLYRRDDGASGPVWLATADDPEIEQSDESPDGASSARVISIPPGTTTFLSAVDGMTLDPSSIVVEPGIYHLRVTAFGIEGPTQMITIVDETGSASVDRP
jgi:hypothetical protein